MNEKVSVFVTCVEAWRFNIEAIIYMLLYNECTLKCNFSKVVSSRPKSFHPAIKEMFAIIALSFLPDNVTVFTSRMS